MSQILNLHIGAPKTGSSSIQQSLLRSRETLRQNGVDYFDYSTTHSVPVYWLFSERRHRAKSALQRKLSERELAAKAKDIDHYLRAFLQNGDWDCKIISGEDISALSDDEVVNLRQYLEANFFGQIKVIVYVRNFYDFLGSEIQERIKHGATFASVLAAIQKGRSAPLPQYKRRIQKFLTAFGRDNVLIRVFDREAFAGGDLVIDFCHALERPDLASRLTSVRANTSVSNAALQVISKYNEYFPMKVEGKYNNTRSEKIRMYFKAAEGKKFEVSDPQLLARYDKLLADDKEFIQQVLTPEQSRYIIHPRSRKPDQGDAPPGDALDLDYLFRTMGDIVLDIETYESALQIVLGALTAGPGKGDVDVRSVREKLKFVNDPAVCRKLARTFLKTRRPKYALAAAEQAQDLEPEGAENCALAGDAHMQLEVWQEAARSYRKLVTLDPSNAAGYRKLSACLSKLNHLAEAVAAARKAVELSPDEERFRAHLQRLESL